MAHQLRPDELVTISFPSSVARPDLVEFHVITAIDTVIALDPLDRDGMRRVPRRVNDCYLTFGAGRGLIGLKGHLYEQVAGDWRFQIADPVSVSAGQGGDVRLCAPITVAPADGAGEAESFGTETITFGAHRALVEGPDHWSPPERGKLMLSLPGEDEPIEATARLVARQGTMCEYRYETIEAEARSRLAAFIIEDKRTALRRARSWATAGSGLDDELDPWGV